MVRGGRAAAHRRGLDQRHRGRDRAGRKTLRRWLQGGDPPPWRQPRRGSLLDPYRAQLERRWAEGCRNAAQLWREMAEHGFTGRSSLVWPWATQRQRADPGSTGAPVMVNGQRWQPPSGRRLARMLMTDTATLLEPERGIVEDLLERAPGLAATVEVAEQPGAPLKERSAAGSVID